MSEEPPIPTVPIHQFDPATGKRVVVGHAPCLVPAPVGMKPLAAGETDSWVTMLRKLTTIKPEEENPHGS